MSNHQLPKGFLTELSPRLNRLHPTSLLLQLLRFCRGVEFHWSNEPMRRQLLSHLKERIVDLDGNVGLKDGGSALADFLRFISGLDLDCDYTHFVSGLAPLERLRLRDLEDADIEVLSDDRESESADKFPVTLILDNIRSAFNVGSIFRVADCVGAQKICLAGYTANPDNSKLHHSAMGAQQFVEWVAVATSYEQVQELRSRHVFTYAVETAPGSANCMEIDFQWPCALIFGNERFGLEPGLIASCDAVLSIPVYGRKNSLNVALAAGIVLYQMRRQWDLRSGIFETGGGGVVTLRRENWSVPDNNRPIVLPLGNSR